VIRRLARLVLPCLFLPLAACGYFSNNWPTLKQDPLPAQSTADSPAPADGAQTLPVPAPAEQATPIETATQASARLAAHEDRLAALAMEADTQLATLNTAPRTPAEWGRAQTDVSRLARTENDLGILADAIAMDSEALQRWLPGQAPDIQALAMRVNALIERVAQARMTAQEALAGHRPEDAPPAPPAPPLPSGAPALTITAEAEPEAYSRAVATLVEKAQAINSVNVYHVVAAPDDAAAERARGVRSLLQAGGVAETRIEVQTDPGAEPGSVRIFVE
jgi:hypothetical protein